MKDRSGIERAHEVYPAAALSQWGLRFKGYKGRENASALEMLLASLRKRTPWLAISSGDAKTCAICDDAFDALVASLVARAAFKGLTLAPSADELAAARVEGWIALPHRESLGDLP